MEHTAFSAKEYDFKIRQTLPFYEELYEQVVDYLDSSDYRRWRNRKIQEV